MSPAVLQQRFDHGWQAPAHALSAQRNLGLSISGRVFGASASPDHASVSIGQKFGDLSVEQIRANIRDYATERQGPQPPHVVMINIEHEWSLWDIARLRPHLLPSAIDATTAAIDATRHEYPDAIVSLYGLPGSWVRLPNRYDAVATARLIAAVADSPLLARNLDAISPTAYLRESSPPIGWAREWMGLACQIARVLGVQVRPLMTARVFGPSTPPEGVPADHAELRRVRAELADMRLVPDWWTATLANDFVTVAAIAAVESDYADT